MTRSFLSKRRFAIGLVMSAAIVRMAKAQGPLDTVGEGWWFTLVFVGAALGLLGAALFLWRRSRKGGTKAQSSYENRYSNYYSDESYDLDNVDADKELEWLRKAKKKPGKSANVTYSLKKKDLTAARKDDVLSVGTKAFQEKMRRLLYAKLPIHSFNQLAPVKRYVPLPTSDDPALMAAIEQTNEEYEEDEIVRELALKILARFQTNNSVEALAQIALYDLSANLRSKAVVTLSEFDHESVFETILLACADPTREVRAAAARGLFRLSFDRAHAWKRIIETNDEFHMRHASRAAVEAGIVTKSLDRLIHEDVKVAYEAFALVSLLIKAGETGEIFDAMVNHKDERVKLALLHVMKVQKDERTLEGLNKLKTDTSMPTEVAEKVRETVKSFEHVAA